MASRLNLKFLFILCLLVLSCKGVLAFTNSEYKTLKKNSKASLFKSSGEILITYVDNFIDQSETLIYKLRLKDSTIRVVFKDNLVKPEVNSYISFESYELDNVLYIYSYKLIQRKRSQLESVSSSDYNGSHKILVVKVADSALASPSYSFTDTEIRNVFSEGDNNLVGFYSEASGSRLSLTVSYMDSVLSVSNLCKSNEDTPLDNSAYLNAISALESSYGSISEFDFISFITPANQNCLTTGILGVATLGKESITLSSGSKRLSVNFLSGGQISDSNFSLRYAAFHEFGHNLGLNHDNAHVCGRQILTSDCPSLEYGGAHSIMGFARTYAHPNTTYKEKLGWINSSEILSLSQTSFIRTVSLYPVSGTGSNTKMIKINRGDGKLYNVELRKPLGYDGKSIPNETSNTSGFLVYYEDSDLTNTILMDPGFSDRRSYMDYFFGDRYVDTTEAMNFHNRAVATQFNDTENNITILGSDLDSDSGPAQLTILKNASQVSNPLNELSSLFSIVLYEENTTTEVTNALPYTTYDAVLRFGGSDTIPTAIKNLISSVDVDKNGDDNYETEYNYRPIEVSFAGKDSESLRFKLTDANDNTVIITQAIDVTENPLTNGDFSLKISSTVSNGSDYSTCVRTFYSLEFGEEFDSLSSLGYVEWDFESDGTYDAISRDSVSQVVEKAGDYNVTIRYTDVNSSSKVERDLGSVSYTDQTVSVNQVRPGSFANNDYEIPVNDKKATKLTLEFEDLNGEIFDQAKKLKPYIIYRYSSGGYSLLKDMLKPKLKKKKKTTSTYTVTLVIPPYKALTKKRKSIFSSSAERIKLYIKFKKQNFNGLRYDARTEIPIKFVR